MIERIEGHVIQIIGDLLSLKVGPLCLSIYFFGHHPPRHEEYILLYTHLIWKQDGPQLYGFREKNEWQLFQELKKVSGIGSKIAGSLIKTLGKDGIEEAIQNQDSRTLAEVRGLSQKSAQRILFEIKRSPQKIESTSLFLREAEQALVHLGIAKKEAKQLIQQTWIAHQAIQSTEELLRLALIDLPIPRTSYRSRAEE